MTTPSGDSSQNADPVRAEEAARLRRIIHRARYEEDAPLTAAYLTENFDRLLEMAAHARQRAAGRTRSPFVYQLR